MDLDLECVASFLVLVQEGHFGRAAARLHISSPGLTKRMQRLERQVGVPLLARDSAGFGGLSAAGARFATQAVPLMAAARAARAAALGVPAAMTVRLGVPGRVGDFPRTSVLSEVARQLAERHPGVRLMCRSVSLLGPYGSLLDGDVDLVWGAVPVAPAGVVTTPAVELERVGVVLAGHELAGLHEVDAEDFARQPLLSIKGAPAQLVHPFTLADIRPARHARLITVAAKDGGSVVRQLRPGQAAVLTATAWASSTPVPGLHRLRLTGLAPVPIFVGHRRGERREPVHSLVQLLSEVAAVDPAALSGAGGA